jgi:hypothetical protein
MRKIDTPPRQNLELHLIVKSRTFLFHEGDQVFDFGLECVEYFLIEKVESYISDILKAF